MIFLLLACADEVRKPVEPVDLTERLDASTARAGVLTDPAALFGGISAEGAPGDVKLYNDRVQFVIEAVGDGSYYGDYGGALIDADLVRAAGEPGRDLLDEMVVMAGLGRTVNATDVEVVADGSDGGAAHVRVRGTGAPLRLITGALENPELVPSWALEIVTDYVLAPGSWTLDVTTTVTNHDAVERAFETGDVAFVAQEVAAAWRPGAGRETGGADTSRWLAAVGEGNEGVLGILAADDGDLQVGANARLLSEIAPILAGFGAVTTVAPEASVSWTRRIGVGPDLATLTGAQLRSEGAVVGGLVQGLDGTGVDGARVHVLDADGGLVTVALTSDDGAWAARVPDDDVQIVVSGRGTGWRYDVPAGAPWYGPYGAARPVSATDWTTPHVAHLAEGWGFAPAQTPGTVTLTPPGTLRVTVADGGPGTVRACFEGSDPAPPDPRLLPDRPAGCAAIGFVRDGAMDLALEPGRYRVLVHRGVRHELHEAVVEVVSGGTVDVVAQLAESWSVQGVVSGDPHAHASPSGDGQVSMEGRLMSVAANGIDVHFGTDHDHVVDYNPLLRALGLDAHLRSIVADEVSPVLRGHFNAYPARLDASLPNGGAPRWWHGYADTAEIFGWMRALVGEDGVIQANHPVGSSGMFSAAGYSTETGTVGRPDRWSDDFDAAEVLNSDEHDSYFAMWEDMATRGVATVPVGVSDAHGPLSGGLGRNLTWYLADVDPREFANDALRDTMRRGATVASLGPFIEARVGGSWAPGGTFASGSRVDVTVHAPSWIPVDRVVLRRDGAVADTVPCTGTAPTWCTAQWELAPESDALYVVTVEADRPMGGPHAGVRAWAATNAVRVDTGGDGWTPPRSPIVVGAR